MTTLSRPLRMQSRRIRKISLPKTIYLLPDGRLMYLWYTRNPIAGTIRPYIAADDGRGHPAYIPPLPDEIWQKFPVLDPGNTRRTAAAQIELARFLKISGNSHRTSAETQLRDLADWLAVMYRLSDTTFLPKSMRTSAT